MKISGILSAKEIEKLLMDKTPTVRIDLTNRIAAVHKEQKFSVNELCIAEQFMRIMVRDTEITVRENLAKRLSDNPAIPRDIIMALANDVDSVALSVIEKSPVLTDDELLSLMKACSDATRLCAIAARQPVSKEIAEKLIDSRQEKVITRLAENHAADIPYEKYYTLIKDYSKNDAIIKAVAGRPNLPVTIVEKVISLVSDALAAQLRTRYGLSTTKITQENEKTREVATLKLVGSEENKNDVEKLVDQLMAFGRLTPSIILTALCRGNLYFFETSLARLSAIPVRNAQTLIHDKGGNGFKALYTKAELPEKFFAACRMLLEVVSEMRMQNVGLENAGYTNLLATQLLAKSNGKNIENLSYVIALIRQSA